jgi:hypothetical protein
MLSPTFRLGFSVATIDMAGLYMFLRSLQKSSPEIQELRHQSHTSSDAEGTTNIIDESLMNLDERLESVAQGMKSIADALAPISQSVSVPTPTPTAASHNFGESSEESMLLSKHAALVSEWEAVQDESEILREELKEDKWLTVFRTVTDQADGMMTSLEKAVNRCQVYSFTHFCLGLPLIMTPIGFHLAIPSTRLRPFFVISVE